MSTPNVPVIDITSFLDGSDSLGPARAVDEAATGSGFFQIIGHGVDIALLDAVYDGAVRLSREPDEVKAALVSPSGHPYRGLMSERDSRGLVCSQRFHASRFDDAADAVRHGVSAEVADFFAPNAWPYLPGFRDAVNLLFGETRHLGAQLMRLFAVALQLPADYFDPYLAHDASSCSINYYPARHQPLLEDPTVIFDEHFDGGTLTILHQRGTYDGLQIRTLDGDWFNVPVVPDAFVINMGELMTRWTNDRWPATRHRVVASADPEGHRTTLTTFHLPAVETSIAPLLPFGGDEDPHYEAVTVYEWERRFITKTYAERQYTTADSVTDRYLAEIRNGP
jgi:isopenicillin N synthase-like dioxygenase